MLFFRIRLNELALMHAFLLYVAATFVCIYIKNHQILSLMIIFIRIDFFLDVLIGFGIACVAMWS
jgi:hypothetical protein